MITQAITRWLHKLFAWWPWRRLSESDYAHTVSTLNKGITQEPMTRTTVDGPSSHPGITSVAIEQAGGETLPESSRPTPDEHADRLVQPYLAMAEENTASIPHTSSTETPTASRRETASPTLEQQLQFLQYLVRHGRVNEGFAEEHIPEQYKKK